MEAVRAGRRKVLAMMGGTIAAIGARGVSAETSKGAKGCEKHLLPLKLFQFAFTKTCINQSQGTVGGLNIWIYTMYVKTNAPANSPVIVSFSGSGRPGAICGVHAQPWGQTAVLVEVNSFEPIGNDTYAVTIMQEGATVYGPVGDTVPT